MARLILPPVAAVVGAVPLAGAPLQAAINSLLGILQIIDVRASLIPAALLM